MQPMKQDILLKTIELLQEFEDEDRESFYRRVFDLLAEAIPFQYAALFLYNPQRKQVRLAAHIGKVVDLVEFVEFELGHGFSAWVAKERKPVLIDDLHAFSRQRHDIRCFLSLPLISGNDLAGVINLGHSQRGILTEEMIPGGMTIASLLAGVIAKNRLITRLSQQNRKIEQMNRDLRASQERLLAAEKKTAVSATIVSLNHEINNPLMAITGNLHLLLRDCTDPVITDRLHIISRQAERIASTLRDMQSIDEPAYEDYLNEEEDYPMLKIDLPAVTAMEK